jgi:4,5-dihydroxyphthalate decarboxylase
MTGEVPLTLACWDYDRTFGLVTGDIRPTGIDLTYLSLPVEETFFRMLRYREFDAAEMSLSSYVLSLLSGDDPPFVAIPAFPSRAFRHSAIYVRADSDITEPADLRGRTVGVAEYQLTANVWVRGILAEHYGLPVGSVRYRTGGLHTPGRTAKVAHQAPPGVDIAPIPDLTTLSSLLESGDIDAIYTPRTPRPFETGQARRLFADPRAEEERYFAETGIFPIMHVVVLRRAVYRDRPWLARSLFDAFEAARRDAMARLDETAATRYMVPWLYAEQARTQALMGTDFWSYGLAGNENALGTFLRYSHEQGLASRLLSPEELFAPETVEGYVI